jgi:hypothetical protein
VERSGTTGQPPTQASAPDEAAEGFAFFSVYISRLDFLLPRVEILFPPVMKNSAPHCDATPQRRNAATPQRRNAAITAPLF